MARKEHFRVTVTQVDVDAFSAILERIGGGMWREVYRTARPDAQRARDAAIAGAGYTDVHGRLFRKAGLGTAEGVDVTEPKHDAPSNVT